MPGCPPPPPPPPPRHHRVSCRYASFITRFAHHPEPRSPNPEARKQNPELPAEGRRQMEMLISGASGECMGMGRRQRRPSFPDANRILKDKEFMLQFRNMG